MDSFTAIIKAFGKDKDFARAIGIEESHARAMKARDSIPSSRWADTVEAARKLKIEGVTLERLARIKARSQ